MSTAKLDCAFRTERVLVDGRPAKPSHRIGPGERWEMVYHRHEPEVSVVVLQIDLVWDPQTVTLAVKTEEVD